MIHCFLITVVVLRVCIFLYFQVWKGSSLDEWGHEFLSYLAGFQWLLKTSLVSTQMCSMPLAKTNLDQFIKKNETRQKEKLCQKLGDFFHCLHAVCCLHLYVKVNLKIIKL